KEFVIGLCRGDVKSTGADVVRRFSVPDRQNRLDGVSEQRVAIVIEDSQHLGVAGQGTRAHAQDEATIKKMIQHGAIGSDQYRVLLREVRGTSPQFDLLGLKSQARQEDHAVRDRLVALCQVFTDQRVVE